MPTVAGAATDNSRTITRVGAQGSQGYVVFSVPPRLGCNGLLYLDLTTNGGMAAYSLLLTAYQGGKQISRVDYHQLNTGVCWIDLVEF